MTSEDGEQEEKPMGLREYKRLKKQDALKNMNLKVAVNPLREVARQRREEMKEKGSLGKSTLKTKKTDLKP